MLFLVPFSFAGVFLAFVRSLMVKQQPNFSLPLHRFQLKGANVPFVLRAGVWFAGLAIAGRLVLRTILLNSSLGQILAYVAAFVLVATLIATAQHYRASILKIPVVSRLLHDRKLVQRVLKVWIVRDIVAIFLALFAIFAVLLRTINNSSWVVSIRRKIRSQSIVRQATEADEDSTAVSSTLSNLFSSTYDASQEEVWIPGFELASIESFYATWKESGRSGSVAVISERGQGASILFNRLFRLQGAQPVVRIAWESKLNAAEDVLSSIFEGIGCTDCQSISDFAAWAEAQAQTPIILIENGHNAFIRNVGGFGGIDALAELINASSESVFWVVEFDRYAWSIIHQLREQNPFFREIVELQTWDASRIREMIRKRTEAAGLTLIFDATELSPGLDPEESEITFFQALATVSAGNPALASAIFLKCITNVRGRKIRLGFSMTRTSISFEGVGPELWFAIAAFAQHERLAPASLAVVLNRSESFAHFACSFLGEIGILDDQTVGDGCYRLSLGAYYEVIRQLQQRHLIYS